MIKQHPGLEKILSNILLRILIAVGLAGIVLVTVQQIELALNCGQGKSKSSCNPIYMVLRVDNIESFGILTAAFLYLLESQERRKKNINEALQMIDNAASSGNSTSYARIKALEYLKGRSQSLQKLNLEKADLNKIDLKGAQLSQACLCESNLEDAHLENAVLDDADLRNSRFNRAFLTGASLKSAVLLGADLSYADLSDADLSEADLKSANLSRANLEKAELKDTNLTNANLKDVILDNADIQNADFRNALNLTPEQVKSARNWEKAKYDEDFRALLGLPTEENRDNE